MSVRCNFLVEFFTQGRVFCHLVNVYLLLVIFLHFFFSKARRRTGPNYRADDAYLKAPYPIFLHR